MNLLRDDSITVLQVWGSVFFSGACTLQEHLPKMGDAQQLQANGGKLMLAVVSRHVMEQLAKTETFETIPQEDVFLAKETLGRATLDALATAEQWLAEKTASEGKE